MPALSSMCFAPRSPRRQVWVPTILTLCKQRAGRQHKLDVVTPGARRILALKDALRDFHSTDLLACRVVLVSS
jgi:hypothetical protein